MDATIASLLKVDYAFFADIEQQSGTMFISSFIPKQDIVWPEKSSYCRFKSILVGYNFDTRKFEVSSTFSPRISRRGIKERRYEMINKLSNPSFSALFYCIGIDYYRITEKGKRSRILDPKFNPLDIGEVALASE